jgi:Ca2+-binding EF-hand superfamily protein
MLICISTQLITQPYQVVFSMQVLEDLPVERLREIFRKYDTSGDGQLDPFELKVDLIREHLFFFWIPDNKAFV